MLGLTKKRYEIYDRQGESMGCQFLDFREVCDNEAYGWKCYMVDENGERCGYDEQAKILV